MACSDDRSPIVDNKASVALLRRLRAGGHDDVRFVHRVDVCAAPPEVLTADLEPVPGTGLHDGGYSSIWYLYHAKKFTNSRGKLSGHRQRAVTGGSGGTGWHSEIAARDVQGSGGGTFCTLSYGIKKKEGTARSIDRLGWCMVEYDTVAADASNYVLCKVYRSPRAKGKSASASGSSSSKKQTAKKRKAGPGGGDHPEAPPAKSIQQQEPQVQQETAAYCYQMQTQGGDFNFNIEDINFYVDESMMRDEPEPGVPPGLMLQHPIAAPEHDGRFIQLPCGPVLAAEAGTVGGMLGPETGGAESEQHGEFTVEWLMRGEPQQPIVEPAPAPGHGGEFIQMPCGLVVPVVAEATVEDMLGLGPETMYGQWSGGMTPTAARTPRSIYAPASSSYTPCSGLLQGQDPLLQYPFLMC